MNQIAVYFGVGTLVELPSCTVWDDDSLGRRRWANVDHLLGGTFSLQEMTFNDVVALAHECLQLAHDADQWETEYKGD